ncbi:hypothetical protein [Rummeliibacillus pycnus]|uniref:hypothetical protein n=1 Tax=Rummeliibacillus pycnus TaxID=101070 RepID=UPI003D2CCFC8
MKNLSLYSLLFSFLGILFLFVSQYLGNVNGDLSKERAIATIIVAILGFISWFISLILGIMGLKNQKKKTILRYSGMFISLLFLFGIFVWGFLLSFSF